MAKIRLVNIMLYGFHGTYEYEREMGQRFYFDVEATIPGSPTSDEEIEDNIHSTAIYGTVKEVVENHRFRHLRALAGYIADKLLEQNPPLTEVTVRVRKASATIASFINHVEIEVTKTREK